ncbi:hypothetical protein WN55_10657 [Dufourea novaeangliae]|uniref:Uncharacterized protein n=1 Tax=Dufourea novaeangliae TaxID=178035 RepID=A0A154PB53_DUFNO|nr:hypothetical protein WN55_10657 [Dufourea novaeangliae]
MEGEGVGLRVCSTTVCCSSVNVPLGKQREETPRGRGTLKEGRGWGVVAQTRKWLG